MTRPKRRERDRRQVRDVNHDNSLDPDVRTAVIKLFQANDEFRRAYSDWVRSPGREAEARLRRVGEAERHIDQARHDVLEAERRAREHLAAPEKTFDPRLP